MESKLPLETKSGKLLSLRKKRVTRTRFVTNLMCENRFNPDHHP